MHLFDRDISFQSQPSHLTINISDQWSINNNPNGGYLMAILANAGLSFSEKKSIAIVTASFLFRCKPGPAELYVKRIGKSRSFDRYQILLVQEKIEKIRSWITFKPDNQTENNEYEQTAPEIQALDQCIQVPEIPNYSFYSQMDIRLEPESAGWMSGNLSQRSEQRGWIRFKQKRQIDQQAMILFTDGFPPPVLARHGAVAWVPTIEMSVNLRNTPESEWLKGIFRSRYIDNGIVEEDGEIWDDTGRLVAISRQISQFRK